MNRWLRYQAKKMFFHSLADLRGGFLEVVCPDETYTFGEPGSSLRAMAVIHDERFFQRAIAGADIGIGESYMDGDWTTPDLVALVRLCVRNLRLFDTKHQWISSIRGTIQRLRHRARANTVQGSQKNIRAHYDLGNDFYELFLDPEMLYSSAYFKSEDDSLESAQLQKLELICQKLNLQPGDRVLEIGCGWGAFAIYAAKRYGAHVTGVTISRAQYEYAVQRVVGEKFAQGNVKILLSDYRELRGQYDKIVSIEMFEAVGFANYDQFFSTCDRLLAPDGSMLIQTITLPEQELAAYRRRVDWIQTYIFPGSELASLAEVSTSLARSTQLALLHVESMGLHYAQTLAIWRERFFGKLTEVRFQVFDEKFQRMWDFYLGWCEGAFRERYINVAQLVFAKNGAQKFLLGDPRSNRISASSQIA